MIDIHRDIHIQTPIDTDRHRDVRMTERRREVVDHDRCTTIHRLTNSSYRNIAIILNIFHPRYYIDPEGLKLKLKTDAGLANVYIRLIERNCLEKPQRQTTTTIIKFILLEIYQCNFRYLALPSVPVIFKHYLSPGRLGSRTNQNTGLYREGPCR